MAGSIFDFTWSVAESGYWWEPSAQVDKDGQKAMALACDARALFRRYSPLRDETSLFLTLAETVPEPDAILAFANRYGHLGKIARDKKASLELLDTWRDAIRWLSELVGLWQTLQSTGEKALAEFVRLKGDRIVLRVEEDAEIIERESHFRIGWREHIVRNPGDNPALSYLLLLQTVNGELQQLVNPVLSYEMAESRTRLSFEIDSLWGAIVLQFAEAIGGQRDYQRCAGCSRWFEVAPGVNRADRLTCSDSCRQKHYRQRKEKAIELHAQGKPLRQIAKEVGSDVQTIKSWLARRKGK